MSKKPTFRGTIDKQNRRRAQALLKSASQQFYLIHWSLASQLSWKKFLLLTCKIFGLLVHSLAADEKYLVLNRDKLTTSIQMQLSQKEKNFSQFLVAFSKTRLKLNFEHFEKKMTLLAFVFRKLRTLKSLLDKCLKRPVSVEPSTRKMADVSKHCLNLHRRIFMLFCDPSQVNCVRKSL